ncbi:MAG: hypothetical protein WCC53_14790 [Thermoanaerobaculia bacterium]
MRSLTLLALSLVLAAPLPSAAQINPAPLPRTPVGKEPAVPANLKPLPIIEDFSLAGGATNCMVYNPAHPRPVLKYHVRDTNSVQIDRKFSGRYVKGPVHLWTTGTGRPAPDHTELLIVETGLDLHDAAQLDGYLLQAIGEHGVSSKPLSFHFRPPMSLRFLAGAVTKTVVGGTPAAPVIRYRLAAAYQNVTGVTVQGRPASGTIAKPLVWHGMLEPPPVTDRAQFDYGLETSPGAISWTYDWSGHSAAQIAAGMQFTFLPEQSGPCGFVTGPPQGPVPGA